MNDMDKARILHQMMNGSHINEDDIDDVIDLCTDGYLKLYDNGIAATTELGIMEFERIIKLYLIFLN